MFFCLLCHSRCQPHSDVCQACEGNLPWHHHGCRACAEPLDSAQESLCTRCQRELPAVDQAITVFHYAFPMDQLILAMKQQPRPDLLTSFARWMSDHLSDPRITKPDLLLPVPMHPSKQRQRGFNQAAVLAHRVGKHLNIPVRHDLLSKRKSTEAQKTLSREQRQRNLANAFKLERVTLLQMRPRPRHIALVDDVITTGTTTAQLAALLKKSGIARVDVWALAKTPLQNPG